MSMYVEIQVPQIECPYCGHEQVFRKGETNFMAGTKPVSELVSCENCSCEFVLKGVLAVSFTHKCLKIEGFWA
jgi:ssDNA-binding Zn-finger/Zn-ribbon topoisomerase 1